MLISKNVMEPASGNPVRVQGRVEFFKFESDTPKTDIGFDIFLQTTKNARQNKVGGVRCRIALDGSATVSLQGVGDKDEEGHGTVPGTEPCFMFAIQNHQGSKVVMKVSRPKKCGEWPMTLEDGEGFTLAELSTSGVTMPGKHVAIRHDDELSMVAVDQLTVEL